MQNVRVLGEETRKVIDSRRASRERKDGASLRWDKVGDRVDRIKTMVEDGDERAGYYIDVLKKDLSLLRDYSTEKGSKMLDSVMTGLSEARERVEDDTGAAVERLREIKKEIKPRIDSVVENIRERIDGEE